MFVKLTCLKILIKIRQTYLLHYRENDTTKDSHIFDKNNNEFEKLSIDTKFKHPGNHEFHKLKQNLAKPWTESISISLNFLHYSIQKYL